MGTGWLCRKERIRLGLSLPLIEAGGRADAIGGSGRCGACGDTAAGAELRLAVPPAGVQRIVELAGLDQLLAIYPDLAAVVAGSALAREAGRAISATGGRVASAWSGPALTRTPAQLASSKIVPMAWQAERCC